MATYDKVSRQIPSQRRSALISGVGVGDQVDVEDVLGRPARGVKFEMTATTDVIDFKLNNLVKLQQHNETGADITVPVWSSGPGYSTFRASGLTEHITQEGLLVASFEVVALTLSSGSTIDVVVW